jgi:hypothetical protein
MAARIRKRYEGTILNKIKDYYNRNKEALQILFYRKKGKLFRMLRTEMERQEKLARERQTARYVQDEPDITWIYSSKHLDIFFRGMYLYGYERAQWVDIVRYLLKLFPLFCLKMGAEKLRKFCIKLVMTRPNLLDKLQQMEKRREEVMNDGRKEVMLDGKNAYNGDS